MATMQTASLERSELGTDAAAAPPPRPRRRRGRPEAAAAIWNPTGRDTPEPRRRAPWPATLVGLLAAAALAVLVSPVAGGVVAAIAVTLHGLWAVAPGAHARVQAGLERFGQIVAQVVTWIVLVPLFYLVVTPFGLLRRLRGHDPLGRRFDRRAPTYWEPRRDHALRLDRPF